MAILGNTVKGNVNDRKTGNVLTTDQVKEIQRVLLMILEDVDRICREHHLEYILIGGTAIGCVRHGGFIPWDDDVDIAMTRRDYEKFREIVTKEYSDKYRLTDAIREDNYGKNIPKLRLKNTLYKTLLKVDPEDREITADIFIIENVENNPFFKYVHGVLCLAIGYCLSCKRLAEKESFFQEIYKDGDYKFKVFVGKMLGFASLNRWAHWSESIYSMCKNDNSKYVTIPSGRKHYFGEVQLREDLCETVEMKFEDVDVKIPKGYKKYMQGLYGNTYMSIPPLQKREQHPLMKLDFGDE